MKQYQTIQDSNGKDLFVLVPIADFEQMTGRDSNGFLYDDESDDDLVELDYEPSDNDGATIPFGVVKIKLENNVNLLGAWRIYRNLSQQEVADKLGLSQGAISQMERKDSKPQKKTLARFSSVYDCEIEQMY
ncbi:XRE family transcriptional regulator [Muribacter muris]|uniref:XRE family transcriptional regulator n=1 Tax=Muribacter muris TaxID=67855 RepID=A0A4Y9JUL1_9PAST|nr:helix-turn-helix transcriptional regulator [Muribacter muris]MBF0785986.1 helix-turn-helix transcriptional regulator [Muribacter muris]MBF0826069.1 helix-turn-helix transcriptional regulator [Muribacter muris]TFV08175.1 XRE family transcriptional regulator [Muribacter muris]